MKPHYCCRWNPRALAANAGVVAAHASPTTEREKNVFFFFFKKKIVDGRVSIGRVYTFTGQVRHPHSLNATNARPVDCRTCELGVVSGERVGVAVDVGEKHAHALQRRAHSLQCL